MRLIGIFAFRLSTASLAQFTLLLFPLKPYVEEFATGLAVVSAWLIHLFGGAVIQQGGILSTPTQDFAILILNGCDGLNVVILLWSAIIAYPAKWKWRLVGLVGGLVAIQGFNLLV